MEHEGHGRRSHHWPPRLWPAVAWSLAETKMRILCLEQGDWMKQSDYPSNGRDHEARVFSDDATSPNIRKRPSDYPINDDNSPSRW
jgi:hypothetical protein